MLQEDSIKLNNSSNTVETAQDNSKLSSTLSMTDAMAIIAGSMIGSGIFIVSSDILRQVQSPLLLIIVWVVAGLMTLAGGLCYGELAVRYPHAGGQYVYLKKIWGNLIGFLFGWTFFLVIQTGNIAAVSVAFSKFLSMICPYISASHYIIKTDIINISTLQLLAVSVIALVTYINTRGVNAGALVQNVFTFTKVIALIGILICGFTIGLNFDVLRHNFLEVPLIPHLKINIYSAMAASIVGALFAADSWNSATNIASEMKDPKKELPKAMFLAILGVVVIYVITNILYLSVLTDGQIKTSPDDIVAIALMKQIFGNVGIFITSIIIMISAFGCVNGMTLSGARVYYAMAKDNMFFKALSKVDKKTLAPRNALIAQGVWASLLTLSGNFFQLLDYIIFSTLIFYILTVGGLFILRKRDAEPFNYKASFFPFLPLFYCALASFTALNLLIYKTEYSLYGLIIILTGIPVYWFWKKK